MIGWQGSVEIEIEIEIQLNVDDEETLERMQYNTIQYFTPPQLNNKPQRQSVIVTDVLHADDDRQRNAATIEAGVSIHYSRITHSMSPEHHSKTPSHVIAV